MIRDVDLIREILLQIREYKGRPDDWIPINVEGYDAQTISYHIKLLYQAGLIEAIDTSSADEFSWEAQSLTWNGQEFYDDIENQTVWNEVKREAKEKGSSASFTVLASMASEFAKKLFLE